MAHVTEAWNVLRAYMGDGIRPPIVRLPPICCLEPRDLVHGGLGNFLPHF